MTGQTATAPPLSLRERKKLRTRRELADAALRLFYDKGYAETTLDEIVDAVEVSKRTFFRNYESKEEVATAAEAELWTAYVERVRDLDLVGPAVAALRDALIDTLRDMPDGWDERFFVTRGLIAGTPALKSYSLNMSMRIQFEIVEATAPKLDVAADHMELRLAVEIVFGAYRCGAKDWICDRKRGGR
ncbi:MAG: TetR/AcrR family transcriptional regulator [Stackebrandtia sp.]